ncbi:hypothetical protein R6Q57_013240 [Mikania cordata]
MYVCRHSTNREVAIMILMAYLSYMLAELFYLSGILTVFFCGIVMSHYTWHNVTEEHAFATLSFVAEFKIPWLGLKDQPWQGLQQRRPQKGLTRECMHAEGLHHASAGLRKATAGLHHATFGDFHSFSRVYDSFT